jgi:hypothetical protein
MSVPRTKPSRPASPPDLETRVANRKQMLIAEIVEHKKNSSRAGAAEAIDKLKVRLSELAHIVKVDAADGWSYVGPIATRKLEQWIAS